NTAYYRGGLGGSGTSDLTVSNSTVSVLRGYAAGEGGDSGSVGYNSYGQGGVGAIGGAGQAAISLTGAHTVVAHSYARGGTGGAANEPGGSTYGGAGAASAFSSAT